MTQPGRYIYGIIEKPENRLFTLGGINGDGISTVNYKDLAAIVSHVSMTSYDRFSKQVDVMGMKHELVLENILKNYTVIPMGFGIIAKSEDDVKKLLETAYPDFKDILMEIDHKVELNIQVTCVEANLLHQVATKNETVQKLRQKLVSTGTNDATSIKIEIGKGVSAELDELKSEYTGDILGSLNSMAVSSCPGKLASAQLLNHSFLVRRDREAKFDREVNRLAQKYEGKLVFRYIGPMPPYSFVRLTVSVLSFDTVDRARQLLGLNERVSLTEIKSAYRTLARQYHPDSSSGDNVKPEKFKEATRAFEIVQDCLKVLKPSENGGYLLRQEQIEGAILVGRRG